ncbi:MAG: DUF58 domain-containing protein [Paludibacteraceae bacterium]|nr:DUF58 domain-containing protein [Paludibacteraceae bacterium]
MFISKRFIILLCIACILTSMGVLWSIFYVVGGLGLCALMVGLAIDLFSVYSNVAGIECKRELSERFSNGDVNVVKLHLTNLYDRDVDISIIDEIPVEYQDRHFLIKDSLNSGESKTIQYQLVPKERGVYKFEKVHVYVHSSMHLCERRFSFDYPTEVKVYPSFFYIRNMQLLSIENKHRECGIKLVRRLGSSMEFDQIKEYVPGDDFRKINWKASARRNQLMSNLFQDEQSQHIYSVIDKGRGMQHTFNKMSLLDYSINATLALSYMVIQHQDNAGLITFEKYIDSFIPAGKNIHQMEHILETLYKEKTSYIQSDYASLYELIRKKVNKRSLIIIYTTFDTNISMERELPFLRKLASSHVVLVVFFKDKELRQMAEKEPITKEDYFNQTIMQNFEFEKKMIVKNLQRYGIQSILTEPENLTVNVINKYIDLKARNVI